MITLPKVLGTATKIVDVLIVGGELGKKIVEGVNLNFKGKIIRTEELYEAILKLKTIDECRAFLEDICTISEIYAMAQRLEVAQMLDENKAYNEISEATRASSTTISRVSRCLNYGKGGYRIVLDRIGKSENE